MANMSPVEPTCPVIRPVQNCAATSIVEASNERARGSAEGSGSSRAMRYREFKDCQGTQWQVFEVAPDLRRLCAALRAQP
jgi:hypothetical protein